MPQRKITEVLQPVEVVPYSMNIAGVAVTMDLHKTHCVLVKHHDGSQGIITEKDIVREVVARCKNPSTIQAWEIMKQPVISIDHSRNFGHAIETMKAHRIRNLIVTRGTEVLGVIKRSKILNALKVDHLEDPIWHKIKKQKQNVTIL